MAAPKNKAALLMALGPLKAKPGAAESEGSDESEAPDSSEIKTMAGDDLWDAKGADDKEGFLDALHRYVTACVNEESGE
jgi:hypothetical protein